MPSSPKALVPPRPWRAALGAALLLAATASWSQPAAYPSKPIRLVVPFAPAGPTDAYARLVGKMLQEAMGQPVVVDNRAGATGLIGSNLVKDAPADGYTLLFTSNSAHVIGPLLQKQQTFDPVADFTPITEPLRYPVYLIGSTKIPAKTFKQLVALGKAQPGKLSYGSPGTGSGGHLGCELISSAAGINALHIPYKGAAPAQAAVLAGETDFMCDSVGNAQAMVNAGKVTGLVLAAAKRSPAAPNVPTTAEEGVPGTEVYVWLGVFGPKHLPAEVQNRLYTEIGKIMRSPEMTARMEKDGYEMMALPPEQFAKDIAAEKTMWAKVIAEKNIKPE
jgi:tripartite-type tricarboxylate transporter receptor subunit TctC